MSRIFISGSSTGLGLMAADLLVSKGHSVVLHARNAKRAEAVRREVTQTETIVVGDVETISGAKEVAAQVNALGHFDAVIHNAAVGYREGHRVTAVIFWLMVGVAGFLLVLTDTEPAPDHDRKPRSNSGWPHRLQHPLVDHRLWMAVQASVQRKIEGVTMHGLDEIKQANSDATNIAVLLVVAKRARRELSRQDTYPAARRPVRA